MKKPPAKKRVAKKKVAAPEPPPPPPPVVVEYPSWVSTASEEKLHDDFRAFVWLLWTHLKLPMPTRRQLHIAMYLQHGPKRRMVQAFRGVGKSWLTAAYVLWCFYRDPQERIMVVSANEERAIAFAKFCRQLIDEVEQLKFLRPRGGQRDSVLAFDVGPARAAQAPSLRAVGITGQMTGGRATKIVSDDVEVPKNSYTETMREKLGELVKEYDAVLTPGGEIIYLGTPQTEQSVYGSVRGRGYECRIWPARYPTSEQARKYGGALAPDIIEDMQSEPKLIGHSTDPERFTDLDLAEREASYGRSGFALQFMLDTSLSDAERYPLRTSDLIVMDVARDKAPVRVEYTSDPRNAISDLPNLGFAGDRFYRPLHISDDRTDWQGKVMVIDPSGRGADETAYAVMYHAHGTVFLMDTGGFRAGYDPTTLESLAAVWASHGKPYVLIESQYGDGMFTTLIQPYFAKLGGAAIEEYKVTGQKEVRIIDDLEPLMNQHRLVVDRKVIAREVEVEPKYSLVYQMTHLTRDRGSLRHDDRIEVVARGSRHFLSLLNRDTRQAESDHYEALRDQMFDDFMESVGHPRGPDTFHQGPAVLRRG